MWRYGIICCGKVEIRDDLLPMLSCADLKSLKRGGLRDGWEHWSYLSGSVLGARYSFCDGSRVTEASSCLDMTLSCEGQIF